MRLVLTSWFFLFMASIAQASAWSREGGALFIAVGGNFLLSDGAELPVHYDPTLYAEYGATETLTLGLDLQRQMLGKLALCFSLPAFLSATQQHKTNMLPTLRLACGSTRLVILRHYFVAGCLGAVVWMTAGSR